MFLKKKTKKNENSCFFRKEKNKKKNSEKHKIYNLYFPINPSSSFPFFTGEKLFL